MREGANAKLLALHHVSMLACGRAEGLEGSTVGMLKGESAKLLAL
jgi:hypothetical protein